MASETRWHRVALGLILAFYFGLSVVYNAAQPIGEAPDEPAHVEFVQYILRHQALPLGPADLSPQRNPLDIGIEFDQVPLYYVVLAASLHPIWLTPGAMLHRNPFVGWPDHPWSNAVILHRSDEGWPYQGLSLFIHAGRLFSGALGLVTLLTTFGLVRLLAGPTAALFGTAWLAWSPAFLLTSSHLNNDSAAAAASTVVLFGSTYLLIARRPSKSAFVGTSLALAVALVSKVHTVFLLPIVVLAVATAVPNGRTVLGIVGKRAAVVTSVLTPGLALFAIWWLIVGHIFVRRLNGRLGVGVAGLGANVGRIDWSRIPATLWWFNGTWWGAIGAGIEAFWQPALYAFLGAVIIILMLSGILTLARGAVGLWGLDGTSQRSAPGGWFRALVVRWNRLPPKRRAACLLVLDAIPLFYATIARQVYPWVDLDANARYVLPEASTIALLVTIGGIALPLGRARRPLAAAYTGGILIVSIATAAYLLPQISAPQIPTRLARTPAEASAPPLAAFASGVELLSVDNIPRVLSANTDLSLILRWRVARTPKASFIVFTHLVGRQDEGRVSSGNDEIPYQRDFPPTLWQAGEIIEQRQDLSPVRNLQPGLYSLQVGMYQLQGDKIAPIPVTVPTSPMDYVVAATWKILPDVDQEKIAHRTDARFGGDLSLLGQSVSAEADGLHVTLTWQALRTPIRHLVVSAQVLDASGKLVAQHDGEPVDGRLPTTTWERGDIVQDTHVVAGAPTGAGQAIIVAVYDDETHLRLPVIEGGRADADHLTLER